MKAKSSRYYNNFKEDHKKIFEENKGKSGIYLFLNNKTGKIYIGQSSDLGETRKGRLPRYFRKSYLDLNKRKSIFISALLKYGYENFSIFILEYCSIDLLNQREQYWFDYLNPEYNILKYAKSSRGYKHTDKSLFKMRGLRPYYKANPDQIAKLILSNKNRVYGKEFRDRVSKQFGKTVYVFDKNGKLVNTFTSVIKLKKAFNITLHHKTLYKRINEGKVFNGFKFSFSLDAPIFNTISSPKINEAKKIQLINIVKPELSKTLDSLNSAAKYIKEVDGKSDKGTMRKYIDTEKLYRKIWKISKIN